jgi:hypothetical protein
MPESESATLLEVLVRGESVKLLNLPGLDPLTLDSPADAGEPPALSFPVWLYGVALGGLLVVVILIGRRKLRIG